MIFGIINLCGNQERELRELTFAVVRVPMILGDFMNLGQTILRIEKRDLAHRDRLAILDQIGYLHLTRETLNRL